MGLRTIYLGDEAIVDLTKFSLQGRPIRKVRQSVTRLQKAGYEAELHDLEALDPGTLAEIETVIERRPSGRARARLLDGDGLDRRRGRPRHDGGPRARRAGRDSRRASFRAVLRPRCRVAVVHAPRPGHAQRAHRVPGGQSGRAAARSRPPRDVAELRGVREVDAQPRRAGSSGRSAGSSRWATRSFRSRACIASTRSSFRAGSRATWCTRGRSDCRAPGSPRCGPRASSPSPRCRPGESSRVAPLRPRRTGGQDGAATDGVSALPLAGRTAEPFGYRQHGVGSDSPRVRFSLATLGYAASDPFFGLEKLPST